MLTICLKYNLYKCMHSQCQDTEDQTSLVLQWTGVCLPMQGDTGSNPGLGRSTCHGAAKPMPHSY